MVFIANTNLLVAIKNNERLLLSSDARSKTLLSELVRHAPERLRAKPFPFLTIEDFVELVDCSSDNLDEAAAVLLYLQILTNEFIDGPKVYDTLLFSAQRQQIIRAIVYLDSEVYTKSKNDAMIRSSLSKVLDELNNEKPLLRPQAILSLLVASGRNEFALLLF